MWRAGIDNETYARVAYRQVNRVQNRRVEIGASQRRNTEVRLTHHWRGLDSNF